MEIKFDDAVRLLEFFDDETVKNITISRNKSILDRVLIQKEKRFDRIFIDVLKGNSSDSFNSYISCFQDSVYLIKLNKNISDASQYIKLVSINKYMNG